MATRTRATTTLILAGLTGMLAGGMGCSGESAQTMQPLRSLKHPFESGQKAALGIDF
jgi:ATP:corrinoid adenosyltransferase